MTLQKDGVAATNPFDDELARANSSYAAYQDNQVMRVLDPARPVPVFTEFVHDSFRAFVLNPRFACVAARGAFNINNYRFGVYDEMAAPGATAGLARDLFAFVQEQNALRVNGFSTFVAHFNAPVAPSEEAFEKLLWAQLQALHDRDAPHHAWDPAVSRDPHDGEFSFSFGERAFFIVGLHPASTRWTRRFAFPTLVFNAHFQFEQLRADGRYGRVQGAIRARDMALQGSLNANLAEFGERSEARQYSGRPVEETWRCPFHAHLADHADLDESELDNAGNLR